MPRRSNDFQRLLTLLHAELEPGAEVEESNLVRDPDTGRLREVDIRVKYKVAGYEQQLLIEC